jgi:soluble lytic murein transglycosylase-like protein
MKRLIHLIGLAAIALPGFFPAQAGEFVVFGNGFRVHADRHEKAGDSVLIFSNGGVTEMAAPEDFVLSVMKAESAFNPEAVSRKGAIGLMQLMPETARELGVNPRNPHENAEGGAQYLHDLLVKYEGNPDQVVLALAAYNAGPAAVERYHGVPPYRETREYILRVLKNWHPEGIK